MRLRLSIAMSPRASFGAEGADLGRDLLERLDRACLRGPPPPALLVVRDDAVWFVDLRGALPHVRDMHAFVASFAGMPETRAVGVIGGMRRRQEGAEPQPVAAVFLEWPDGSWWGAWRDLGADGRPVATDSDDIQSARAGHARPGGLGGWFSRARREQLRAALEFHPRDTARDLDN